MHIALWKKRMTVLLFSTPLSRDPMKMLAETGIQAPTGFCESLTVPARILKPGAVYSLRHLASPWWPRGVTVAAKRASQCIHSAPYPAIHSMLFEHSPWAKHGTHVACGHMEKKRASPLLPRNFLITPMLQTKGLRLTVPSLRTQANGASTCQYPRREKGDVVICTTALEVFRVEESTALPIACL